MPVFYCRRESFEGCPYRLIDLNEPHPICDYIKLTVRLMIDKEFSKIPRLTSRACDYIKTEEGRAETVRRLHRERFKAFLEEVQVGDTVFHIIAPFHEVKLIDKPSSASDRVRCRTPNGQIIEVRAGHLFRIDKGDYFGEYLVKGAFSRRKTLKLEFKAKRNGFRTEIEKRSDGYLLKIFGDSQEQVDDFIFMVLEQGLDLERFLADPY